MSRQRHEGVDGSNPSFTTTNSHIVSDSSAMISPSIGRHGISGAKESYQGENRLQRPDALSPEDARGIAATMQNIGELPDGSDHGNRKTSLVSIPEGDGESSCPCTPDRSSISTANTTGRNVESESGKTGTETKDYTDRQLGESEQDMNDDNIQSSVNKQTESTGKRFQRMGMVDIPGVSASEYGTNDDRIRSSINNQTESTGIRFHRTEMANIPGLGAITAQSRVGMNQPPQVPELPTSDYTLFNDETQPAKAVGSETQPRGRRFQRPGMGMNQQSQDSVQPTSDYILYNDEPQPTQKLDSKTQPRGRVFQRVGMSMNQQSHGFERPTSDYALFDDEIQHNQQSQSQGSCESQITDVADNLTQPNNYPQPAKELYNSHNGQVGGSMQATELFTSYNNQRMTYFPPNPNDTPPDPTEGYNLYSDEDLPYATHGIQMEGGRGGSLRMSLKCPKQKSNIPRGPDFNFIQPKLSWDRPGPPDPSEFEFTAHPRQSRRSCIGGGPPVTSNFAPGNKFSQRMSLSGMAVQRDEDFIANLPPERMHPKRRSTVGVIKDALHSMLGDVNLKRRDSTFGGSSGYSEDSFTGTTNGPMEYEVTTLEMLSDLVIVVAIHIVASALEEEETYVHNLIWYCIHCFHLWIVWHYSMITFHISHLFKDTDNPIHYLLIFCWMVNVILLAQSYVASDNTHALMIFMLLRVFETVTFYVQVRRRAPRWFNKDRLELMKMHSWHMIPCLLWSETVPLTLAIIYRDENGPNVWLVLLSTLLILGHRTHTAYTSDKRQEELQMCDEHHTVYDEGLLKERYELMAIIFIGEICFAAAGPSDEAVLHYSFPISCGLALMAAFGCFMLIFTARNTHNRIDFWERPEVIQSFGQHTWAAVFLVIPGIGAGYLQVMEAIGHIPEGDRRLEDMADFYYDTCSPSSSILLNFSSSAFQLLTCLLNFLAIEDESRIKMTMRTRMSIRFFFAVVSSLLIFAPDSWNCVGVMPVAAFVSPICLVASAAIEIMGLQSKGSDFYSYFTYYCTFFNVQPILPFCSQSVNPEQVEPGDVIVTVDELNGATIDVSGNKSDGSMFTGMPGMKTITAMPSQQSIRSPQSTDSMSNKSTLEYEVTTLECFSDLVILVAIHIVACSLESEEKYMLNNNLVWYSIHCIHLWVVWHYAMITFHISHLFKDTDNPTHLLLVFGWMMLVILLAQSYVTSDNTHALIIFMILRGMEVAVFYVQVRRRAPKWFNKDRLELMKIHSTHMIPSLLLCETLPLSIAIFFRDEYGPNLPMVIFSICLIIGHRTISAHSRDRHSRTMTGEAQITVYDEGLLKERYELIAIIFIGEICFAAAGPSDEAVMADTFPLSCTFALMAAFGCFMLIFTARNTHNRVDFWERSELIQSFGQHTWAAVFLVIPGIGAGYLQVMEAIGEIEEGNGGNDRRLGEADLTCSPSSSHLLNHSSSIFQLLTIVLNFLAIEFEERLRMGLRTRMSIRFFFATVSSSLVFAPDSWNCIGVMPLAAIVSPVCLVLSAAIEIIGLQTKENSLLMIKGSRRVAIV